MPPDRDLTPDFLPEILPLPVAELRPACPAPAPRPTRVMTVKELIARTGWSARSAGRAVAAWFERQHDPRVPRVSRVSTGKPGRPAYRIDPASFDAWRSRGAVEALAA